MYCYILIPLNIIQFNLDTSAQQSVTTQLVGPRISKSSLGGRAFSCQVLLLWKQLQVQVHMAETISKFKIRIKTSIFDRVYS